MSWVLPRAETRIGAARAFNWSRSSGVERPADVMDKAGDLSGGSPTIK